MVKIRKKYFKVGLGGTFDHFHAGHAKFLSFASELGAHLVIGVTDPQLTRHKPYEDLIEPYSLRAKAVHHYCNQQHIAHTLVRLEDQFGPTLEGSDVRALVVTPETQGGADKINQVREKLQLPTLPVYICEYFMADNGLPLHAADIRAGKANRQGRIYDSLFTADFALNNDQRAAFQAPQGPIVPEPSELSDEYLRVVVGDRCLDTFESNHWSYQLGVFDKLEQRASTTSATILDLKPTQTINNSAGEISLQLIKALKTALTQKKSLILINGEEDLAAVALVLLSPLQTHIYYGQPGEGMVEMVVTEELKDRFYQILR